jgi:hypothetical protein
MALRSNLPGFRIHYLVDSIGRYAVRVEAEPMLIIEKWQYYSTLPPARKIRKQF